MPDVEINGVKLAYDERGAGPPVVFVHGGFGDQRRWAPQMEAFSIRHRVVALSCRHYYLNEKIPEGAELRLTTLVEDLAGFIRALGLAPAHLVGHSSGAFVCLLLALKEPGLVHTLVLGEPPILGILGLGTPPTPLEILRLVVRSPREAMAAIQFGVRAMAPASRAFERGDDEYGLESFVSAAAVGREPFSQWPEARRQQALDNVAPFRAALRTGLPRLSEDEVRRVRTPTLLVSGTRTAPVFLHVTNRLQRLLPVVERVDVHDASHAMFEDEPEACNRAVLAFLERHGDR